MACWFKLISGNFHPQNIPTCCNLCLLAGPDPTTHQSPRVLFQGCGLSKHMGVPSLVRPHCGRRLLFSVLPAVRNVSPDPTSPFLASPTAPITAALRLSLAQSTLPLSPTHQPLQHLAWFNSFLISNPMLRTAGTNSLLLSLERNQVNDKKVIII